MEQKFREILNSYEEQIARYEAQVKSLESKIAFCSTHKFEEEVRIARVEYNALDMCIYRWRNMYNELTELINAWES